MNRKVLVLVFCLYSLINILGATESDEETFFCDYEEDDAEFRLMGHSYDHKNMTYKITKYSSKISNSKVKTIVAKAFEARSNVTDLTFKRKRKDQEGSVDIDIRFEIGPHGNDKPFDGRGHVLAHAGRGHIHFDDSENWSRSMDSGVINLYAIAVHEIGHALGLSHSNVKKAVMYPSYNPRNVVWKLHSDDIEGIQSIYGRKITSDDESSDESDDQSSDESDDKSKLNDQDTHSFSSAPSPSASFPSTPWQSSPLPTPLPSVPLRPNGSYAPPSNTYSPSDPHSSSSPYYPIARDPSLYYYYIFGDPLSIPQTFDNSQNSNCIHGQIGSQAAVRCEKPSVLINTQNHSPYGSYSPSDPHSSSVASWNSYVRNLRPHNHSTSDLNSLSDSNSVTVYHVDTTDANSPTRYYSITGTYNSNSNSVSNSPISSYSLRGTYNPNSPYATSSIPIPDGYRVVKVENVISSDPQSFPRYSTQSSGTNRAVERRFF